VIVAAVVVAVIVAFVVFVVADMRQQAASEPPSGVEEFEVPTRDHTEAEVSYEQSPPVGGDHNPIWQNAGFYEEPVRDENAVHTLEHGAVWITYSPDLPQEGKDRVREIVSGQDCVLASPFPGLDAPVVASAWGKQLRLEGADDPNLERFVRAYQRGPQTPEPGAACTGGLGDPA
jgi:Protein of unknown function (DUF3105)